MRLSIAAIVLIALSGAAFGQNTSDYKNDTPMFNFSAGYERTQANAPPGTCQCFSANGGYISGSFFFSNHLSAEARFSGATSSNISSLGQNLNLYTIVAGPKLSFTTHRFSPYVHVLFGEAQPPIPTFPPPPAIPPPQPASRSRPAAELTSVSRRIGLSVSLKPSTSAPASPTAQPTPRISSRSAQVSSTSSAVARYLRPPNPRLHLNLSSRHHSRSRFPQRSPSFSALRMPPASPPARP
jgi:hypothetical protein